MDFNLTDTQRMIQELSRDFAQEVLAPAAPIIDQSEEYPFENCRRMGELGLMGIEVPEQYGGTGADTVSYVVALEEVSKACASTGTIMSVNNSLVCHGLVLHGTPGQRERYLRPAATFQRIGAFCLSEPQAGSDAAAQRTRAERDGDHYVVNGAKNFISSGGVADFLIVFCVTDPEARPRHRGISCLLIDSDTPGFSAGKPEEKLGIRAANTSALSFEDCRVPVSNLLGEEGQGFRLAMEVLDAGRIGIASQALGIAQASLEASRDFALQREQFGKPLAEHEAIQFMLADMGTRTEAARLLTLKAAVKKHRKEKYGLEAAMAKLYAAETAMWCAYKAVQIHGGYGYVREYNVERYFRDAKITEIYEGTSEVQRIIIARHLLHQ
jgi:butyryl-CoA dehydrogenase